MNLRFINSTPCRSCGLGRGFILGVAVGLIIGYVLNNSENLFNDSAKSPSCENLPYHQPLRNNVTGGNSDTDKDAAVIPNPEGKNIKIETMSIIKNSSKENRVLCWILTSPKNHWFRAIHVKRTWGKRCDKLLFMSSKADPRLPSIGLPNVKEGRDWLWAKTKEALKYIYANHLDDADWFLKADDDTYVIMENLKDVLKKYNTTNSLLFGYEIFGYHWIGYSYMDGGAGYVMSKEALKRFVEKALNMTDKSCYTSYHDGAEDMELSKCLIHVNTKYVNGRDRQGRERFNPYPAGAYDPARFKNLECCSDTPISFHYTQPHEMHYLEYMVYHLGAGVPKVRKHVPKVSKSNVKANQNKSKGKSQTSKPKTTVKIWNTENFIVNSTTASPNSSKT